MSNETVMIIGVVKGYCSRSIKCRTLKQLHELPVNNHTGHKFCI